MKKTKYRSRRLETLHRTAAALDKVGALDKTTMRDIDAFCLTKVEALSGRDIQALREREGISQAVLGPRKGIGYDRLTRFCSRVRRVRPVDVTQLLRRRPLFRLPNADASIEGQAVKHNVIAFAVLVREHGADFGPERILCAVLLL